MAVLPKIIIITLLSFIAKPIVTVDVEPPKCIHQGEELWPHINPNSYWYCQDAGSEPVERSCTNGRGFLLIENQISGCVPYEEWNCTSKAGPPSCEGSNYHKPHKHVNPNKFWACTEEEPGKPSVAVEAQCLDSGRGFVDNEQNLGCIPWDLWVCDKPNDRSRH